MGNYDLLPHQEQLLRSLVEEYRKGGSSAFIVKSDAFGARATISWQGATELPEYDETSLLEDLNLMVKEGLLVKGASPFDIDVIMGESRVYQITKAAITAVDNNFQRPDRAEEHLQCCNITWNITRCCTNG